MDGSNNINTDIKAKRYENVEFLWGFMKGHSERRNKLAGVTKEI